MNSKLKLLYIHTTQGYSGTLSRESQIVFNYKTDNVEQEIGLTMPLTAKSYNANVMPGVLRQNFPEGYLLNWINENFGKTMILDDFSRLALTGKDMIGRVRCSMTADASSAPPDSESLAELLTWRGTEDLFSLLAAKYAAASGISGVQPKVLVPRVSDEGSNLIERGTIKNRDLIVKAAGVDYDGLPENEFHCMTIGRNAGLQVPKFWLSDDKGLFLIERFDRDAEGNYLGFEDMTSLTGKQNEQKYDGSYEMVAKAVTLFASPRNVKKSLNELFKSIVLSMAIRNGDAHLKNFGMLYTHTRTGDVRLSPLYDIVNTTAYIHRDVPALKLKKEKLWPTRERLIEFGYAHCQVDQPAQVIDRIIEAAMSYVPEIETGGIWGGVRREIDLGCKVLSGNKVHSLERSEAFASPSPN